MQKQSCDLFKDNDYMGSWNGKKFDYITYGQFGQEVDRFRTALAKIGIGKDDKVALISNNRIEWAVTYYAANGLGAQIVPLYEAQTEADWRYIIEHSESKALIVATQSIYDRTIGLINEFERLEIVLCLDGDTTIPYSYKHLMANVDDSAIIPSFKPPTEHLSAIVYTSGSTGNPKGVEITHSNLVANLLGIANVFGEEVIARAQTKSSVNYLPWSHIFGLTASLHSSLGSGGKVALAPNREFILQTAEIVKPYEMSSVPILLNKIYAGVHAKVAEGTKLRQYIVKKAFEIARKRNSLVEKGLPVDASTAWWFEKVDKIVMTKIRGAILGGNLEFLSAGGGKTSLQVLQFFEDVGIPLCEGVCKPDVHHFF
jgi:long-chain acyl-CoA synthetase